MSKLDPRVEKILKKYHPNPKDAVWGLTRGGKTVAWIAKHKDLEIVAASAGVEFDLPQIIQADAGNKIAVVCVSGAMGDRTEWSFGESASYNTNNGYPFAMAEKRAKDRVILKLIGLHGDVYSEEEADDFKKDNNPRENEAMKEAKKDACEIAGRDLILKIEQAISVEALRVLWADDRTKKTLARLYKDDGELYEAIVAKFTQRSDTLKAKEQS